VIIVTPLFSKSSVFKMFFAHSQTKAGVFKFVFEKLRFRDGLEWTVGLTMVRNLRFLISPA